MTNLKLLRTFLEKAMNDNRLSPGHISLYVGIFQHWAERSFQNPMSIVKDQLMQLSKLNGKATYYKVMRDLHEFGYIQYLPGHGKREQSQVKMTKLDSLKCLLLIAIKLKVKQVMQ
jgi:hypothetical protein